jgi:hypothetical protein
LSKKDKHRSKERLLWPRKTRRSKRASASEQTNGADFFSSSAATLTSTREEWETVVRLNGRYREPPGGTGAFVDGPVGHDIAYRTSRFVEAVTDRFNIASKRKLIAVLAPALGTYSTLPLATPTPQSVKHETIA